MFRLSMRSVSDSARRVPLAQDAGEPILPCGRTGGAPTDAKGRRCCMQSYP